MWSRNTLFRAEQSRAEQPITLRLWLAFLGEPRMGAVTQIRDLDSAPGRAWADCALFASCGCGAFETEYNIRDG